MRSSPGHPPASTPAALHNRRRDRRTASGRCGNHTEPEPWHVARTPRSAPSLPAISGALWRRVWPPRAGLEALRQLACGNRKRACRIGQDPKIAPRCGDCPQAANELDAQPLANLLGQTYRKATNLASRAKMRATTGVQIDAPDLDQTNVAVPLRQFAQLPRGQERVGFGARDGADSNRPVLRNDLIGESLHSLQTRMSDRSGVEVDGRALLAEMERNSTVRPARARIWPTRDAARGAAACGRAVVPGSMAAWTCVPATRGFAV